jgi:hypothetical protein
MPENEEAATAVYAKMVHKGVADDVNRAISGQTQIKVLRGEDETKQAFISACGTISNLTHGPCTVLGAAFALMPLRC